MYHQGCPDKSPIVFTVTLDDTWVQLRNIAPGSIDGFFDAALVDWGICDAGLTLEQKKKHYVRFVGLEFGVTPPVNTLNFNPSWLVNRRI